MSPPESPHVPALLRLPIELRTQIYTHLIPQETVSHPLPSVGITAVSHRPPSLTLLLTHPTLTHEVLDHFYQTTTWKLIFSHAFNFFRIDPDLRNLEASPILQRLRKVEVVFFCDILLLKEYPSFGLESFCAEIRRRADRACDVLLQAPELGAVTVSWVDTTSTQGWEAKAGILAPLRKLQTGKVRFRIGEITGPEERDRERFLMAVQDVLGPAAELEVSREGVVAGAARGQPSSLRMLAFDVRQERRLISAGAP